MPSLMDQPHADGSMSPQERRRLDERIVNQLRCLSWVDPALADHPSTTMPTSTTTRRPRRGLIWRRPCPGRCTPRGPSSRQNGPSRHLDGAECAGPGRTARATAGRRHDGAWHDGGLRPAGCRLPRQRLALGPGYGPGRAGDAGLLGRAHRRRHLAGALAARPCARWRRPGR
jgi:hypothetical protein